MNMPNFKAVYDPSNFVGAGEAPLDESLPNIREYVDYLHLKDSRKTDNVIVPCGEGDAQIADILPLFADGDYFLTLEPHLVLFASLQSLETEDAANIIKKNKAKDGAEGYAMQYHALREILDAI